MHSFVKCLFWDMSTNLHISLIWNQKNKTLTLPSQYIIKALVKCKCCRYFNSVLVFATIVTSHEQLVLCSFDSTDETAKSVSVSVSQSIGGF